jgi:DNA-binding NarL/FixJ family response regulator
VTAAARALAAGARRGGEVEVALRIELARAATVAGRRASLRLADEAVAFAEPGGRALAAAYQVRGTARFVQGRADALLDLRRVATGDYPATDVLDAASALVEAELVFGDLDGAVAAVTTGRECAARIGARGIELHFDVYDALLLLRRAQAADAAEVARGLFEQPLLPVERARVAAVRVLAAADLGRVDEEPVGDVDTELLCAQAEARWLLGDVVGCLAVLAAVTDAPPRLADAAARLRAWAMSETGRPVASATDDVTVFDAATRCELTALAGRTTGEDPTEKWLEAAAAYAPRSIRDALRCKVAAAESAAAAGRGDARALTQSVVDEIAEAGARALLVRLKPVARRVDVSLPREPVPGDAGEFAGGLTQREHEVLRLVADGLASRDIAVRLGVASSTVDTHVRAAMRKLGATTRKQAAVLAQSRAGV